jgi:hypothetical protein
MKKVFLLLFFQKKKTLPACHLPGFFRFPSERGILFFKSGAVPLAAVP